MGCNWVCLRTEIVSSHPMFRQDSKKSSLFRFAYLKRWARCLYWGCSFSSVKKPKPHSTQEHSCLGWGRRPKVQGMFQSDKLPKQSLIILSQLGTVFSSHAGINLFSHQPLLPTSCQIPEEKPKLTCCLYVRFLQSDGSIEESEATLFDSRVTRGFQAYRGLAESISVLGYPSSLFLSASLGSWHLAAVWLCCSSLPLSKPLWFTKWSHLTNVPTSCLGLNLNSKSNGENIEQKPDIC